MKWQLFTRDYRHFFENVFLLFTPRATTGLGNQGSNPGEIIWREKSKRNSQCLRREGGAVLCNSTLKRFVADNAQLKNLRELSLPRRLLHYIYLPYFSPCIITVLYRKPLFELTQTRKALQTLVLSCYTRSLFQKYWLVILQDQVHVSTLVLNYSLWAKFTVNWPHPKFSEHFLFPAPFITHYENV